MARGTGFGPRAVVIRPEIEAHYRERAQRAHPDKGGSDADMAALNQARIDALASLA